MEKMTSSDICNNVLILGESEEFKNKLIVPLDSDKSIIEIGEWKFDFSPIKSGNNGYLYASKIRKNDFEVSLVNSSEQADLGKVNFVVFSDDVNSVVEFFRDFNTLFPQNKAANGSMRIFDTDIVTQLYKVEFF